MFIRFDHPEALWLLLLAVPIVWLGRRSLASLEPVRRWTSIGLRLAVLLILVLMLAGLQAVRRHTDLTVIAVMDQSESVRQFVRPPGVGADPDAPASIEQWVQRWLRESADGKRPDDRLGLVTYDGRPTVRVMPSPSLSLDPGTIEQPVPGTDTAAAIRTAMALFPPDAGARLLLISDGNDTAADPATGLGGEEADVIAAALEARAAGIPIDVLPLPYRVDREVMVEGVYAPTEAREGRTIALRVVLRATRPTAGQLQLLHDEEPVDLNGPAPGTGAPVSTSDWTVEDEADPGSAASAAVSADANANSLADATGRFVAVKQIDLPTVYTGANRFEAVFEPADSAGDVMVVNNRAEAFTLVQGKGKVLFVDNVGGDSGMILPEALSARGIELEVIGPARLPSQLSQLQRYDAVVLQNVPASAVTGPQQRMLAKYVNDLGGGLIMLGGPDSFGAGGWTNSPIDRILPVTCQVPSQTVLPSGALVLVIDRSGSMAASVAGSGQSQQVLANEAAVLALNTLYPQDMVGVVAFDDGAYSIVDLQYNSNPAEVAKAVRSIQPGGGTNIYSGLEMAYDKLARLTVQDAAVKHVILLTDGNSTPPPGGSYIKLVGDMNRAGISLSTVGVGDGHDAQLLNQLAQMGQGRYHPISNPNQLPQIFVKEATTIRKNLIKEEPFVPQRRQTGSPIMANVGSVPELKGLVLTGERQDPRVFMPLVGPEGEPVFAHWQVGLGRVAAFTSDATNRWAVEWLQWGGYGDFWARTVRAIGRPARSRDIDLVTAIRGDRLHVRLDAASFDTGEARRGPVSSFTNFLDVRGSVLKPDGTTTEITLEQTGPGVYEAVVPADAEGSHIVSLFVQTPDGERRVVFGGANRPPGEELRRFQSNLALLRQVAELTGGRFIDPTAPQRARLFTRERVIESRSIRPLWRVLLVWLLVLFLLDVACRRIAWDPVAIARWTRRRASALAGTLQTREVQAETTMAALKARRAATREGADAQGDGKAQPGSAASAAVSERPAAPPSPDRTRKFDADPNARAADDFADAVGGAETGNDTRRATDPGPGGNQGGDTPDAEPAGNATSRLRAAKQRARQRLADQE